MIETVGEIVNGRYVRKTPATAKQKAGFAEMLRHRSPPKALTDREFFEGLGTLDKQFDGDPEGLKRTVQAARRNGYKASPNDVYLPAIAEFQGDPLAFVPATGGRGHIEKVLKQRNMECDGVVTTKRERQPVKRKRLGDDLVREGVCDMVRANPDLRKVNKFDLASEVINQHGSKEN